MLSKSFLLSSSNSLYLCSNPSGRLISEISDYNGQIHLIRYSPESKVVATAALGDRFITVILMHEKLLSRIGSLMCSSDVRTFAIFGDTILAVTNVGALEVFRTFSSDFEPEKKGGLNKRSNIEISFRSPKSSKVEIQDVVQRDNETLIMWRHEDKLGFKSINLDSMAGTVEIDVDEEQLTLQVHPE
jgi:hypothetical protein